jgi:glycine cleavage system H lipoate-binding protein
MFPWVDGFHWTIGHIVFLALFFMVVVTIAVTVVFAVGRTARHLRQSSPAELCWKADFAELPEAERRCRHELAGRVDTRTCDNAFDCRHCSQYPQFAVQPTAAMVRDLGIHYSDDRFYHRGHTWVEPQQDGTLTIGLDELAEHLVGTPDSVRMPAIGADIALNGTAWRMKKNGNEIRVRAPIEGKVLAIGGPAAGWYLKICPRLDPANPETLRHLLRKEEVPCWLYRELERLQLQIRMPNTAPTLADGGVLVDNIMDTVPEANWDSVLAATFLEA